MSADAERIVLLDAMWKQGSNMAKLEALLAHPEALVAVLIQIGVLEPGWEAPWGVVWSNDADDSEGPGYPFDVYRLREKRSEGER